MEVHSKVVTVVAPWGRGGHVVLYLLRGERIALIDTGASDTPETVLAPALAEHGLKLGDIDLILNTHGHHDHAGGNAALQAISEAKVFISKDENPKLLPGGPQAIAEIFGPLQAILSAEQFKFHLDETLVWTGLPYRIDRLLSDGDVVNLGGGMELEVVSIPGHSPGSIGYYWRQEGIMFAGDAMNGRGSRVGGLPIICDTIAYEASIQRLLEMPLQRLCLAHNYASFHLPAEAVRSGNDIRTFLVECNYVNNSLRSAADRAVKAEPGASLWRQGERLLEELPSDFQIVGLTDILRSLWSDMGVYHFIWRARQAQGLD